MKSAFSILQRKSKQMGFLSKIKPQSKLGSAHETETIVFGTQKLTLPKDFSWKIDTKDFKLGKIEGKRQK